MQTSPKPVSQPESAVQPWGAVAALVVGVFAYIVAQLSLGLLLVPLIVSRGEAAALESLEQPWLSLVLTGVSFAVMLGIVWLFLRSKKYKISSFGFARPRLSQIGLAAVVYVGYFVVLATVFAVLATYVPSFNANETQDVGFVGAEGWQLALAFLGLVVIAPIAEEIFFRGFLYKGLRRSWPKWLAVIVTSALFALVHWQWNVGVDVFLLSLALIFVYEKTGTLWLCIAMHATKNLIAFLYLFVFLGR